MPTLNVQRSVRHAPRTVSGIMDIWEYTDCWNFYPEVSVSSRFSRNRLFGCWHKEARVSQEIRIAGITTIQVPYCSLFNVFSYDVRNVELMDCANLTLLLDPVTYMTGFAKTRHVAKTRKSRNARF